MGTVYLAATRGPAGFEKLKVVKRLHSGMVDDAQFLTMFLEEARLAARLNHPNIVQTNEVGFDGRDYFIEMEYLEGQPLDVILRRAARAGGLPTTLAIWVLAQVLAGLAYAHELKDHGGKPLGIVHRDVSPHNVFVTYDGVVKVLDFGIAKAADSAGETRSGMVKGKATYMAPEQAMRRTVDARADVFAVGVMMWEALTKKRLWEGLQDGEIFQKLAVGAIPRAREADPEIDEKLDAICVKGLACDADLRWSSAAEMQAALEEWLEGSGEKFGQRALGKWVSERFAERRAATQTEVDAQLAEMRDGPATERRDVDVPALGTSVAYRKTRTGTGATKPNGEVEAPGDSTSAAAPQSLRGLAVREPHTDGEPTRTGSAHMRTPSPRAPPRRWRVAALGGGAILLTVSIAAGWRIVAGRQVATSPSPSASRSTTAPACAKNADCAVGSAVCRTADGVCVALKSDECRWILGDAADVANDATEWIGVMIPNADEASPDYRSHVGACDLARRDFAEVAGGLPAASAAGSPRPFAMIVCDDSGDADAAARHLVDLRVPAVIGFRDGTEAVHVITNELLPNHVLAMVALNTSALITQVPQPASEPRLVWRTTYSNADTAAPLGAIVTSAIEPRLRSHGLSAGEKLRVALVHHNGSTGLAFADRLFSVLRFNAKSALDNGGSYLEVVLDRNDPSAESRAATQLVAFAPHVILHTGNEELATHVFPAVEDRLPRGSPRPTYLAGSELGSEAVAFARSRAGLRDRFFGLTTESATDANAKFVTRYNALFPQNAVTRTRAPNTTYDAAYALAYAIVATGRAHPGGPDVARALSRLSGGATAVDVGPTGIFDAVRALGQGESVELSGTAGSLDWDAKTGDVPFVYAVLCVTSAGSESTVESGMTFDTRRGTLRGALACD
jgi:serine/threonine-protein kinase